MALNQYDKGSANNGPNAWKKGNRTPGQPRNGKELGEFSRMQSADIERYREMAEKARKKRRIKMESLGGIIERLNDYIDDQAECGSPLTIAGLIRAAGVSRATWYEIINGDYDYILYQYCDLHHIDLESYAAEPETGAIPTITDDDGEEIPLITPSEALQKAVLAVEEQTEKRLYEKGRVGEIFALKAVHGWSDDGGGQPQSVQNTLVIASPEQAKRAIDLLK